MIQKRAERTPEQAVHEFNEWAALFSGELFVKLAVYADESGTHDKTGALPGSGVAIVGGIVAPIEEWSKFCRNGRLH